MDEFNNRDLQLEMPELIEVARQVNKNGFNVALYKDKLSGEDFSHPYVIDIEDTSFFYANKSERDLDYSKILQIFADKKIS